ncbi:MAG: hypothetical protein LBU65_02225 [Planctomycetaceae bacterium]|jgi:hypothetical protein|nr:hypothetical protein [Planctomycetaceae bacterium]
MQIPFEIDYNYVLGLAQQLPQSEQAQLFQDLKINDNKLVTDERAVDSLDSFFTPKELEKLQDICKESDGKLAIFVPEMSCFSQEEKEEMRRNREAIESYFEQRRSAESLEEHLKRLSCFPVATEEDIKLQDEVSEELRRWRS